jgi:exonuclease VII large subunit
MRILGVQVRLHTKTGEKVMKLALTAFTVIVLSSFVTIGCTDEVDSWRARSRELAAKAETRLAEAGAQLDSLQLKIESSTADAREELREELERLEQRQEAARRQVEELKATSQEKWEKAKERLDQEMERIKQAIKELEEKLNDSE